MKFFLLFIKNKYYSIGNIINDNVYIVIILRATDVKELEINSPLKKMPFASSGWYLLLHISKSSGVLINNIQRSTVGHASRISYIHITAILLSILLIKRISFA